MDINRNNYEGYFILYLDNELSMNDRKRLEEFVRRNPDLEEELVMLQQSKLVADHTIQFDGKELLMKQEVFQSINLSNYEEQLLLYVDNELTTDQRIQVEKFIAQHPGIQKELELLERTKVQSELDIVFPDKKLLFKKEKKDRSPVVRGIPWLKLAAAAVVIFAIGFGTFIMNRPARPDSVVKVEEAARKNFGTAEVTKKEVTKKDNGEVIDTQENKNNNGPKTMSIATAKNLIKPTKQDNRSKFIVVDNKKNEVTSVNNKEREDAGDIVTNIERTNTPVNILDIASTEKNPQHFINNSPVTPEIAEAYDIADASNKKLRGFFRKATRIFERATNINATDEDDKLLVGGFAINLK